MKGVRLLSFVPFCTIARAQFENGHDLFSIQTKGKTLIYFYELCYNCTASPMTTNYAEFDTLTLKMAHADLHLAAVQIQTSYVVLKCIPK